MLKKILITLLEIVLLVLLAILLVVGTRSLGRSEGETFKAWIICQPNDYVNAREQPSRKSRECGYFLAGYPVETDGVIRNGFLRCYGFETGVAWVHTGYVVYDEPTQVECTAYSIAKGRLAARKCIGGKRRCWLKVNEEVRVYWVSDEWCVTNRGFVKTEFLEMEGE